MVFNAVFNFFFSYIGGNCTYPCFPGVLLTSTPHNILSKPPAAFPRNHCRNNGQRSARNQSSRNDYHQFSERILAEPGIQPATSYSHVRYAIMLGKESRKERENKELQEQETDLFRIDVDK